MKQFSQRWLPAVETHLRSLLSGERPEFQGMWGMMRYHIGWEDQFGQPENAPQGKRVRPLVVLMACQAAGGDPAQAIPAAAAVELLHNFSLIHDDIEDGSDARRHRPTLWTWAGAAQAINTGDAMFSLARIALNGLSETGISAERVLLAQRLFDRTCLHLTEGQYLDMDFETRLQVSLDHYLIMIAGKTAALLAACAQLGAIIGGADEMTAAHFWRFGHELGLSFQIQDDILGIWGDEARTGKSVAADILTRKKTLPVLWALAQSGPDAQRLRQLYALDRALTPADLPSILPLFAALDVRAHAEAAAEQHAQAALAALTATNAEPDGIQPLRELAQKLLGRDT